MTVTRKFSGHNSRKNEVKHFGTGMFDLVFLELWPLNLRVTIMNNLRPLSVSFDVGSAALLTSVESVMTTCARTCAEHVVTTFWTEVDSAALPMSTETDAVDFSWNLHENLPLITREKRGQTLRDRNVWPRFSRVIDSEFSCNFYVKSAAAALVFWRRQCCAIDFRSKCRRHHVLCSRHFERKSIA